MPPIVGTVLLTPGTALDEGIRSFMETRFGHDFSQVRVHADARAAESARALDALAYTVGSDVVFGTGTLAPETREGKRLLAHELTHVVQQRGVTSLAAAKELRVDAPDSAAEAEAQRVGSAIACAAAVPPIEAPLGSAQLVSRADRQAVALTMNLGQTIGAGLQFLPINVTDTQVGPVSVQGGLLGDRASRLNVIVGENSTLRTLAQQLLPLWLAATPFTPPGAAAPLPLDIITEEELAQALLVYNQTYLPVPVGGMAPAMTNWRSGLRFPLPVEIDETTGVATLHPLQIRALAGGFNPAWAPHLDVRATATTAPPAATLQGDAAAFLARETTALARGIHLGARALTNAVAELPFLRETFRQLGVGAFDVALAFLDNLVNREVGILAAQRDGAAILAEIRTALAAGLAMPTAAQQESLARANLMLGLIIGVAAAAPPAAVRSRAEKTLTIDTVKLHGSNHTPAVDVAVTNGIYSQCSVRLAHAANSTATAADTTTWLGADGALQRSPVCGSATSEERNLFQQATARFGLGGRIRAFFPSTIHDGVRAYSYPPFCATGLASGVRNMANISNLGNSRTLAHEVGHILLNSGAHPTNLTRLMGPAGPLPQGATLTDAECTTIYDNV